MKKKLLALILSVAVVASIAAAGTLAYLTDKTDAVTNTFTVGNVALSLQEHELLNDGSLGEDLVMENYYTRMLPGEVVNKDPFVTVEEGSEDCYVYVCVENKLNAIQITAGRVATSTDMDTSKWIAISDPSATKVVYRLGNRAVSAYEEVVTASVFKHVIFNDELTNEDMEAIQKAPAGSNTISLTAFAHQAENISMSYADGIACETFGVTALNADPDNIW